MERQPQRSPRRSLSAARTLERVVQAIRHARAGRLEALEGHLSDLIGQTVTLQISAPEEPPEPTPPQPTPPPPVVLDPPERIDVGFLQPRMATVLALIVAGQTDKEIAETLGVSYTTARTYVRRLCSSLRVSGRRGVYLWAQRRTKLGGVEPV